MISFDVGEDLEAIVEMVKSVADDVIRPRLREFEDARGLPEDVLQQIHELGLTTLAAPEDAGGQGLDLRTACVVAEELAAGDVGAAVAISGPGPAGWALLEHGTDEQRKRLLEPFAADDAWARRGALALLEGAGGFGPDAVGTTARRDGDGWVLDGKKRFVLDGDTAELTVVVAVDADAPLGQWDSLRVLAIEGRPEGMTASEPHLLLGLHTAHYCDVELAGVRVPGGNLLEADDARRALGRTLARWKLENAARLVGCMRATSEYAFKYATERETFGKKLYEHQGLAFMMADMATEVNGARWAIWRAAWELDRTADGSQPSGGEARQRAAIAFRNAIDTSVRITSDGVQVLGGHGYITDHPSEKWMRDARTLGVVNGLGLDDDRAIAEEVLR